MVSLSPFDTDTHTRQLLETSLMFLPWTGERWQKEEQGWGMDQMRTAF